jgi:hypothetical protein
LFLIRDTSGILYTGGDQRWFGPLKDFRHEAACGATTCSNIMSYLARRPLSVPDSTTEVSPDVSVEADRGLFPTFPAETFTGSPPKMPDEPSPELFPFPKDLSALCPYEVHTKDGFLELMKDVYHYVRPGLLGVMTNDFIRGAYGYAASRGVDLRTSALIFPASRGKRPSAGDVYSYIGGSLSADLPVAFLNLSNGRVPYLDSYHWVTISALDDEEGKITIVDNGRTFEIDLALWIKRTTMGGAFVTVWSE